MNTFIALQTCLVLHLTGLVLMAGLAIADLFAYNNFWKQYALDPQQGLAYYQPNPAFQKWMAIGAADLLLTGIAMMALTHGVFGEQLWMKIKIGIVVLIIINGPVLGRIQGLKLKKLLAGNPAQQTIAAAKGRVKAMAIANLLFLATIVILSIFKFN